MSYREDDSRRNDPRSLRFGPRAYFFPIPRPPGASHHPVSSRISLQGRQKVLRNGRGCRTRIGRLPSLVLFRGVDGREPRRLHAALRDELLRVLDVGLGPGGCLGPPRANPLEVGDGIQRLFAAINPPPGETFHHTLCPRHTRNTGRHFVEAHVEFRGSVMVLREPSAELACGAKGYPSAALCVRGHRALYGRAATGRPSHAGLEQRRGPGEKAKHDG